MFDHFITDIAFDEEAVRTAQVTMPNTARNQDALLDARALLCGGQEIEIEQVDYAEEEIRLSVGVSRDTLQALLDGQNCVQVLS